MVRVYIGAFIYMLNSVVIYACVFAGMMALAFSFIVQATPDTEPNGPPIQNLRNVALVYEQAALFGAGYGFAGAIVLRRGHRRKIGPAA